MPITAPTITATANNAAGSVAIVIDNNGSGNSYNEVCRAIDGGAYTCIATSVAVDGTFTDYNIRSGKTYSYYAQAFDGSGVSLNSEVETASVTLSQMMIHQVTKSATSNKTGDSVSLFNQPGQAFELHREKKVARFAAQAKPDVDCSDVVERTIRGRLLSPQAYRTSVAALKTLYATKAICYVRDSIGNGFFAVLPSLPVAYDINDEIELTAWETDYNEAVS